MCSNWRNVVAQSPKKPVMQCVECGNDIGYQRLRARPVATRCIHCQTQHERTFGTHVVGQVYRRLHNRWPLRRNHCRGFRSELTA